MRLRYIILVLVIAAALAAGFYGRLSLAYISAGPLEAAKLVYIPPGSGTRTIATQLTTANVIDDPFYFRLLARLHKLTGNLKAGEYQITAHASIADIIALLQSGKTYQHKITIAEGLTSTEIKDLVNKAEAMTGAVDATPPEGSLLPETYSYSYNDTRAGLINRMQKSMQDTLNTLWAGRIENPYIKTPQDAVTLASVVEKETALPAERPRVAAVFLNRLKIGMPLQTDPTVIYALTLGKMKLDRPLSRADLNVASPYNTYINAGLPPGPIANPGKASLEAVLHPEQNDYLYFVADGSGGHAFAATLEAHDRNVAAWRKIQSGQK